MKTLLGQKGFVTIATGDLRYYILANNLLRSYRMNANCKEPFAIIAESENQYTDQFDHVILMDNPSHSYNDKLRLFEYLPFEETIFIDADSLIYDDLNSWWMRFSEASDFSAFGIVHETESDKGWFQTDGMREFSSQISYVPIFNGGVYYIRNSVTCRRVFEIAQHCANHYSEYSFNMFARPADEPVLALGMAVCGCKPIKNELGEQTEYIFSPKSKRLKANVLVPVAVYHRDDKTVRTRLIHWSNYLTQKADYKFEIWKMDHGTDSGLKAFIMKHVLALCNFTALISRRYRSLKRLIKNYD